MTLKEFIICTIHDSLRPTARPNKIEFDVAVIPEERPWEKDPELQKTIIVVEGNQYSTRIKFTIDL